VGKRLLDQVAPDPSIRREREAVLSTGMRARAVECGFGEKAAGKRRA
jgi:hypothetical protein